MTKDKKAAKRDAASPSPQLSEADKAKAQQAFIAELVKRELGVVSAFTAFLEKLPAAVHLDHDGEVARVSAVAAGKSLAELLGAAQVSMGLASV